MSEPLGIYISTYLGFRGKDSSRYYSIDGIEFRTATTLKERTSTMKGVSTVRRIMDSSVLILPAGQEGVQLTALRMYRANDINATAVQVLDESDKAGFDFSSLGNVFSVPQQQYTDSLGVLHQVSTIAVPANKDGIDSVRYEFCFAKIPRKDSFYVYKAMEQKLNMRLISIKAEVIDMPLLTQIDIHYYKPSSDTVMGLRKLAALIK